MVSLPPVNPNSGSHVEPKAVAGASSSGAPGGKPEAVRFMLGCWAVMILGELLHQILTVISVIIDPSALKESARQAAKARGEEIADAAMNAGVWSSVFNMAAIQLLIIGLFAAALIALQNQKRWAPSARRLLQVFSIFFVIRGLTLFVMRPVSTAVPIAFYAFDGVIQIILAVAAGLGVFYASQKESRDWAEAGAPPEQKE